MDCPQHIASVDEAGPLGLAWTDCAAGPTASWFQANALRLPVDVAAFGDDEYGHFSCSIVNAVHDPVLTKPHPPIISASNEFLRSRRARIMRQTDDRLKRLFKLRARKSLQLFQYVGMKLDPHRVAKASASTSNASSISARVIAVNDLARRSRSRSASATSACS